MADDDLLLPKGMRVFVKHHDMTSCTLSLICLIHVATLAKFLQEFGALHIWKDG